MLLHKLLRVCVMSIYSVFILFYIYRIIKQNRELFESKIDRTRLYGSLFLDNLDSQIISMSNPPIKYDTKRLELTRYSDMLL